MSDERRAMSERASGLSAAVIAGVYEHPTRWAPDKTPFQIHAESARGALADAGLTIADVDGFFTAGVGPIGIMTLAEHLNLSPRHHDSTNIGGSSFVAHVLHAAAAISAGLCSVALITYGSTASSQRFAVGTAGLTGGGDPPDQFEAPFGPTVLNSYALVAQRHMHEFGTTSEQLAEIAVTIRRHAGLNPAAKFREPITVEDVLASRIVSSPLHLLDCCIISDGGGALVVTGAERARDLAKQPIRILGGSEALCHTRMGRRDLTDMAAGQSAPRAMAMAGVKHADVDLCMIYDSFTITVLETLENLGFCKRGEGGGFVQNGRIGLGGALPVNTDGGGLSSNHPGMRGIFLVIEAVKQLRGECGERQVEDCEIALCHGTGGMLGLRHSGVTLVLGRGWR
jgi:acetyl-CoA C-acetyltransferase